MSVLVAGKIVSRPLADRFYAFSRVTMRDASMPTRFASCGTRGQAVLRRRNLQRVPFLEFRGQKNSSDRFFLIKLIVVAENNAPLAPLKRLAAHLSTVLT